MDRGRGKPATQAGEEQQEEEEEGKYKNSEGEDERYAPIRDESLDGYDSINFNSVNEEDDDENTGEQAAQYGNTARGPAAGSYDEGAGSEEDNNSNNVERGHPGQRGMHRRQGSSTHQDAPSLLYSLLPIRLIKSHPMDKTLQASLAHPLNLPPPDSAESFVTAGNVLWVVLFGWVFYVLYGLVAVIAFTTIVGRPYARLCWKLKNYFLWPFGKYITRRRRRGRVPSLIRYPPVLVDDDETLQDEDNDASSENEEELALRASHGTSAPRAKSWLWPSLCGSLCSRLAYGLWILTGGLLLSLFHGVAFVVCWFSVVGIPMAKVNQSAAWLLLYRPLEIQVYDGRSNPMEEILLCAYQATNYNYYRFQVQGLNVVLVNLLPFVGLTLILGYVVPDAARPPPFVIFVTALLSISPIAYYIGMAVASIAAQTNFAIGAMLTAIFGVSIEIILYSIALYKGGLVPLVQAGVVGSLLGDLLLLPGLSMIAGGLKYHEQRFSARAAGVSSVLLIVSIIGVFAPTMYWQVNGDTTFSCDECIPNGNSSTPLECTQCHSGPVNFYTDPLFQDTAQPLIYTVAAILPVSYLVGLLFTLKTHSHIFNEADGEGGGHDAPHWSKTKAVLILAVSIVLFSLVAEELVKAIEPTLEALNIGQTFAGVTVLALVPSSAEYVNAITFALSNNVALSLEIGAVSAVQISQIMLPVLVCVSGILDGSTPLLIFPFYSAFAVVFAVIIVNYISIEGAANYFRGVSLVVVYCLFIVGFYFHKDADEPPSTHASVLLA